jgi:dihydroorotate dehydrogenase electron transfer subunit
VLLGAKNKKEILAEGEFKKLGFEIHIATDDGSRGFKGNVTSLLKKLLATSDYRLSTNLYACGPKEMFYEIKKVLEKYPQIQTQVSFEQFMGCGLGICYGCVIETKEGYKKVCKDGPVFDLKII